MKVAIVILNWNGKDFLEKFLPPLILSVKRYNDGKSPEAGAEIIVADNASSDGSIRMLHRSFPGLQTIIFQENYGFTGGYNRALAQIDAAYYVLLNSDVEVPEEWLEPLVEWMDSHTFCGVCAPKLHSWTDRDMFEYAGAAGGFIDKYGYPFCRGRILNKVEKDYGQYDEPSRVFWASGACMMVRSEVYRMFGGLDERFFAHMEEIDFCWKLQLAGYYVNIVPDSTVYHVGGGSLPNGSPRKIFLNYRNNLLMLRNNLSKTYAIDFYNDGCEEEEAAAKGIRKAHRTIFRRMFLDGCAAMIYLLSFKFSYFKAVLKAHGEYRKLYTEPSQEEIAVWLKKQGKIAGVDAMYRKWIVPMALMHGKKIFRILNMEFNYDL